MTAAFDTWVEDARAVTVRAELERRGLWSRKMIGDAGVPCPGCGGRDRFAVNARKNLFFCRRSGAGGDAIALVRHVDDCGFLAACETLTGAPPPGRDASESAEDRAARIKRLKARAAAQLAAERKRVAEGEKFRAWERRAAFDLWCAAKPIRGTPAEAYLEQRGLVAPTYARLRYAPDLPYHVDLGAVAQPPLWRGPAMVAGIQAADGAFIGLHRTWIDLEEPDGKKVLVHPETGEILKAKKTRGSKKGGSIRLAGHPKDASAPRTAARMIVGEGIETTLSAYVALPPEERASTEFHAAVDLGNLAGRALGRVPYPSETTVDRRGRTRRLFVAGAVPDPDDDTPPIGIADSVTELILLGDGDSEPFATGLALQRAASRHAEAYPGLTVRLAMARAGQDFNAMLRAA